MKKLWENLSWILKLKSKFGKKNKLPDEKIYLHLVYKPKNQEDYENYHDITNNTHTKLSVNNLMFGKYIENVMWCILYSEEEALIKKLRGEGVVISPELCIKYYDMLIDSTPNASFTRSMLRNKNRMKKHPDTLLNKDFSEMLILSILTYVGGVALATGISFENILNNLEDFIESDTK